MRDLVTARYDLEKLKPGWKGRFVVHDHRTITQKGTWKRHFDLRLEFPVLSLKKALKHYEKKREFDESREPAPKMPDKPGTVARSWAIPKAEIPKGVGAKLWMPETEPHDMGYMSFRGKIGKPEKIDQDPESRERIYGEGTVEIHDSGTFELLDAHYDKQYVVKLMGRKGKASGLFALVKFKQGYLLVRMDSKKEEEYRKTASIVDYPRPGLSPHIWNEAPGGFPVLKREVKVRLITKLLDFFRKKNLREIRAWLGPVKIVGSLASNQYKDTTDLDVNVQIDWDAFIRVHPEQHFRDLTDARRFVKHLVERELNGWNAVGNVHPVKYFIAYRDMVLETEGIYDVFADRWLRPPLFVASDVVPARDFALAHRLAMALLAKLKGWFHEIEVGVKEVVRINEFLKEAQPQPEVFRLRAALLEHVKGLLGKIHRMRQLRLELNRVRFQLPEQELYYHQPGLSRNWSLSYIVLKFLDRYGYGMLEKKVVDQLTDPEERELARRLLWEVHK